MMKRVLILATLLAPFLGLLAQVNVVDALNAGADNYAVAFRSGVGVYEIWITSGTGTSDLASRRMYVIDPRSGSSTAKEVVTPPFNDPATNYFGVPIFHPCDPNIMVYVADAKVNGRRTSNDLYYATYHGDRWHSEPLPFNGPHWDDTPAFGKDGNTLYFSSDRRQPGSGHADLYIARRTTTGWTEPELLRTISTEYHHEVAPNLGPDGRLYFASSVNGDLDLWSVALDADGMPTGTPSMVSIDGVNQKNSNELHPAWSPDGRTMVFSSDRDRPRGGYRIYSVTADTCDLEVVINVVAKTSRQDVALRRMFGTMDSISYVATSVRVRDQTTRSADNIRTDDRGRVVYRIRRPADDLLFSSDKIRTLEISATPHSSAYVGNTDTIIIDVSDCRQQIEHSVFLYDTTIARDTCQFVFRTFNVPFFITAYWCPTTKKYRSYTPCASLFTDDQTCEQIQQPVPCENNEAYTYEFTPAVLKRVPRRNENCVRYDEFNKNGERWAMQVDSAIERMRDEVAAVFNESCMQEAVRRNLPVQVVMFGTTDDRSIDPKCQYTGKAWEDIQQYMSGIAVNEQIIPFIRTHQRFNSNGYGGKAGGNQLLSDLRSLYFSVMFDRICRESIPLYGRLRQNGQLTVVSRGEAIDARDIPYEYKRAAGVTITVPNFQIVKDALKAPPGRRISYCKRPCGCE